jgi:hypothetical protein
MKIGKNIIRTFTATHPAPLFPQFPKYEKFNVFTSDLDEKVLDFIDEASENHLISSLDDSNQTTRKIGLYSQGSAQGMLRLVKRIIGKATNFRETLVQPVWAHPCDWNSFFSLALREDILGSCKKLYWAGVNSSHWVKNLEDSDLIISYLPGELDKYGKIQENQENDEKNEKFDLQRFLKIRVDEMKTNGKILVINQVDFDGSWSQLMNVVDQVIDQSKELSLTEKKNARLQCEFYKFQDLEKALKNLESKTCVLHQQIVHLEIGDRLNHYENLGKLVKEKVGSKVFFALDKGRKFEERQEIIKNLFYCIDSEVKVSFMKPFEYSNQISILG